MYRNGGHLNLGWKTAHLHCDTMQLQCGACRIPGFQPPKGQGAAESSTTRESLPGRLLLEKKSFFGSIIRMTHQNA